MTAWTDEARRLIGQVHAALPADATVAQREAAIRAAFPDGWRGPRWPYKAWLIARKEYLARYRPIALAPPTALDLLPRDPVTGRPVIA